VRRSLWVLVCVAAWLVSGCASPESATAPVSATALESARAPVAHSSLASSSAAPISVSASAVGLRSIAPSSSGVPVGTAPAASLPSAVPVDAFPAPIRQAVAYLQRRTTVPMLAPIETPDVTRSSLLSAQATTGATSYEVDLYTCSPPLPLNDPGVGNTVNGKDCSGNADMYGGFAGYHEANASAAEDALPTLATNTPTQLACPPGNKPGIFANLDFAGISATTLTCPTTYGISGGFIFVRWLQAGWTIVVQFGDDTTLPATVRDTATAVATQLTTTALPASSGLLEINEAADGQHTEAAWVIGSNVYVTFNDHLSADAITMIGTVRFAINP
jgi:hypothetical protein